jgi:D-psicose/D-tagatose/L-ribulose 3-epimerase
MPTFGVHAFVWNGSWDNDIAVDTIQKTARAGFDMLEVPLLHPDEFDGLKTKRLLKENGLRAVGSLALPKEVHLPFYPEKALGFLKQAVDCVEAIEGDALCGCVYCNLGTLTGKPPTKQERDLCVNVLGELAHYAKARGIRIGVEPVNRYETYLYNVGEDTVELIKTIGADNMFVHFDTYHMVIEEKGFSGPIKQAGPLCQYIHLSESGRGVPGEGNVDWDDVFAGLKAVNYTGPLVLEAFAEINPDLIAATCLWRPGTYSAEELATKGLAFLRAKAEAIGLA